MRLLFITVLLSVSIAAQALSCGSRLVVEGDNQYRVTRACGAPDFVNTYYETKYRQNHYGFAREIEIKVDEWTYNFGSTRLIYTLKFENGYLTDISTSQGYGFRD